MSIRSVFRWAPLLSLVVVSAGCSSPPGPSAEAPDPSIGDDEFLAIVARGVDRLTGARGER